MSYLFGNPEDRFFSCRGSNISIWLSGFFFTGETTKLYFSSRIGKDNLRRPFELHRDEIKKVVYATNVDLDYPESEFGTRILW